MSLSNRPSRISSLPKMERLSPLKLTTQHHFRQKSNSSSKLKIVESCKPKQSKEKEYLLSKLMNIKNELSVLKIEFQKKQQIITKVQYQNGQLLQAIQQQTHSQELLSRRIQDIKARHRQVTLKCEQISNQSRSFSHMANFRFHNNQIIQKNINSLKTSLYSQKYLLRRVDQLLLEEINRGLQLQHKLNTHFNSFREDRQKRNNDLSIKRDQFNSLKHFEDAKNAIKEREQMLKEDVCLEEQYKSSRKLMRHLLVNKVVRHVLQHPFSRLEKQQKEYQAYNKMNQMYGPIELKAFPQLFRDQPKKIQENVKLSLFLQKQFNSKENQNAKLKARLQHLNFERHILKQEQSLIVLHQSIQKSGVDHYFETSQSRIRDLLKRMCTNLMGGLWGQVSTVAMLQSLCDRLREELLA